MPFVETGEFANVGVILFAPNAQVFGFRLLGNRHARISNFFEQLDARVFRAAMRTFREEMERVQEMLRQFGADRGTPALDKAGALRLWTEIVKPRETMLRFGEPRVVLATDPQAKLLELYRFYVERNFATREYQEQVLERGVRACLREARLSDRFHPARVGNDEYHAQFPFVAGQEDMPDKVIKPLNLDYAEAARIIDHGGQWIVRVNALRKRNLLPGQVLFTVKGPEDLTTRGRARKEVVDELSNSGVIVVPYDEVQSIVEFARR